jgi:DNA polymerase III delta prime subunit
MDNLLWVETYRPSTIDECILPVEIKKTFKSILKQGEVPNLLLSGTAGTGKTTVAKALCNELDLDVMMINGSDEGRSIDVVRERIKAFASTVSLSETNKPKVVIVDEADYMNAESVQPALRNFIETFSNNCRFIFTCNYKNKIIPAIHSRCTVINFNIQNKDKQNLAGLFHKRLCTILEQENIEFDKSVVAKLIVKYYPDFRRTINELQRYSVSGKIDTGILVTVSEANIQSLNQALKGKKFNDMRKWVVDNIDQDPVGLYKELYQNFYNTLQPQSIPPMIILLAEYQYKNAFVADPELNMVACLTEIMGECKFK